VDCSKLSTSKKSKLSKFWSCFFVLSLLESKGGRNESGSSMRASANRSGESRGAVLLSQQVVPILLLLRVRRERVDR